MSAFIKLTAPGPDGFEFWVRRDTITAVSSPQDKWGTHLHTDPSDLDAGFVCAETAEQVVEALDHGHEVRS